MREGGRKEEERARSINCSAAPVLHFAVPTTPRRGRAVEKRRDWPNLDFEVFRTYPKRAELQIPWWHDFAESFEVDAPGLIVLRVFAWHLHHDESGFHVHMEPGCL